MHLKRLVVELRLPHTQIRARLFAPKPTPPCVDHRVDRQKLDERFSRQRKDVVAQHSPRPGVVDGESFAEVRLDNDWAADSARLVEADEESAIHRDNQFSDEPIEIQFPNSII